MHHYYKSKQFRVITIFKWNSEQEALINTVSRDIKSGLKNWRQLNWDIFFSIGWKLPIESKKQ